MMGEDIGHYGGCYAVSRGLLERFGPERIRDTPLSENGFTGAGIGAALGERAPHRRDHDGELQPAGNGPDRQHRGDPAAHVRRRVHVPLVIRMATGAGRQVAAQHSHSLENWYAHVPGLKVLAPATLEDARYMLWAALQDPNPVLIFEHVLLYNQEGRLEPCPQGVDIEQGAIIRRATANISLITYGGSLPKTLEAAEALAEEGIDGEVMDLRVLRPLDTTTLLESVSRTHRAVIVDEGWKTGSLAGEIAAILAEQAFWALDAPIERVCTDEIPIPYPRHLENAALPQVDDILAAARRAMGAAP
jgi:2-oxoisovalerate dehydrogenase E1 component